MQLPEGFSADASRSLGGPEWLVTRRLDALERLQEAAPPAYDEDLWRYGRVAELDLAEFSPVTSSLGTAPGAVGSAVDARAMALPAARSLLEGISERAATVVVSDGVVTGLEVSAQSLAAGLVVSDLASGEISAAMLARVADLNAETGAEEHLPDVFDLIGDAFLRDAISIVVPARATIVHPVLVVHLLTARATEARESKAPVICPRTLVEVGEASQLSVVELFVSPEGTLLSLPQTSLFVGDGAILTYHAIQELGSGAWQIAHQRARAGRDATIRTFTASLGGEVARYRTESVLSGQGGSAEMLAAYFGDGTQMHDFRTVQEHGGPKTSSDLVFKGAVAGTARSVYSGLIRMRKGAKGANAFQTNRNLVLSDGAHADSVPNLDIEENDVRCSHASAVGQIDPEQRFYLESRGVRPDAAERLILLGFFQDLFARLSLAPVRDHLVASLARRLDAVGRRG